MMKFTLGHVFDLTEYAKKTFKGGDFSAGYFICEDVWDFHVYRIQIGVNSEYEAEEDTKIIEEEQIHKSNLIEYLEEEGIAVLPDEDERCVIDSYIGNNSERFKQIAKAVADYDYDNGLENWGVEEYRYNTPIEDLLEDIDGGYGITKLDEDFNEVASEEATEETTEEEE